jgi:hypothetical protein
VCTALVIAALFSYTPSIDRARAAALSRIDEVKRSDYIGSDGDKVLSIKNEYRKIISRAYLKPQVAEAYSGFSDEIAEIKTKAEYVDEYADALGKKVDRIYSKVDRATARRIIRRFRRNAMKCDSTEEMESLSDAAEDEIDDFKTKTEVKLEKKIRRAVVGRWKKRHSHQFHFRLESDGSFVMPIVQRHHHGHLFGTWDVSGTTVTITITENTLDPDYDPYDWVFHYDRNTGALIGTGSFSGWKYTEY